MKEDPLRIVTGHNAHGKSVIAIDDHCITVGTSQAQPDMRAYEVWETQGLPVSINDGPDPTNRPFRIEPPQSGTVIRIADIPPDTSDLDDPEKIKAYFASLGSPHASTTEEMLPNRTR